MKKKILLIGKTGQLGGAILEQAPVFGFDIIGYGKTELNINDKSAISGAIKKIKPDILINTSAFHVLKQCEENPFEAMRINFLAVGSIASLCKKYGVRFVTYSTDYVFDGKKGAPYLENDGPDPLQVYGSSKLAGEYAALNIYPEESYVIRTCGLYGGKFGSRSRGGNFVLKMLEGAKQSTSIEVSSEQIVSPTFAGDLGKASLLLLQNNSPSGIYHLVNEGHCSWYEFAREIFLAQKIKTKVVPVNRGGFSDGIYRPCFSALENYRARTLGIFLPQWQEGLASYLKSLRVK